MKNSALVVIDLQNDITMTVRPNPDYRLKTIRAYISKADDAAEDITLQKTSDSTYTFTMPDGNVTVSAEFERVYTVTVVDGTLAGNQTSVSYAAGETVTLTANSPEADKQFKGWTGLDGLTITSGTTASSTLTFTMPAQAVTATATYEVLLVQDAQDGSENQTPDLPKTGDHTPIALLAVLCAISFAGISVLTARKKKAH